MLEKGRLMCCAAAFLDNNIFGRNQNKFILAMCVQINALHLDGSIPVRLAMLSPYFNTISVHKSRSFANNERKFIPI